MTDHTGSHLQVLFLFSPVTGDIVDPFFSLVAQTPPRRNDMSYGLPYRPRYRRAFAATLPDTPRIPKKRALLVG